MKTWIRGSMVWLAAVALLAGCETENSVTGSFGDGVVVGQVVMAGELAGTSPAGVEVTVPELGMAMVLGADGRFVLSGIPGDAMIRFGRASDGIAASYALQGSKGSDLVIELAKSTAKRGRMRPSQSPKLMQLEGTILEVGEGTLTMQAAGKGVVTVVVDESTSIRKGYTAVPFADLAIGDRIHVVAEPQAEGDPLAKSIVLQNPSSGKAELEGLILELGENGFRLDDASRGEVDVLVDEGTVIRKGNRVYDLSQLLVGDRVHVKAVETEDGFLAREIMIQARANDDDDDDGDDEEENTSVELEGKILEISAESITVDAAGKGPTTAAITEETVIRKGNRVLSADDLKAGDRVHVKAEEAGEELIAREIKLQN